MVYRRDRAVSPSGNIVQGNHRIIYPPSGTIIALDPDIPDHLQKVGFVSQASEIMPIRWMLNDQLLENGRQTILWTPQPGKHVLAIINEQNKIVDQVNFEVR